MRFLLLALFLTSCSPGYVRVQTCGNCPTSTVYRGARGMVCRSENRLYKCGKKVHVLVPDHDQVRTCEDVQP